MFQTLIEVDTCCPDGRAFAPHCCIERLRGAGEAAYREGWRRGLDLGFLGKVMALEPQLRADFDAFAARAALGETQ